MPEQHRNRSDIARDRLNVVAQIGQLTDSTNRMSEANYLDPAVAEENARLLSQIASDMQKAVARLVDLEHESKTALQAQVDEDWPGAVVQDDGTITGKRYAGPTCPTCGPAVTLPCPLHSELRGA
jgi:hypothetical protein